MAALASSQSSPSPRTFLSNRWLILVASCWLQSCAGIGYAYGSFSPLLKSTLGYNQKQINLLGNAKDIGDAIGLISGSLIEIIPTWSVVAIGAFENILGYGWLWLIVTQRASVLPYWAVCALIFVGTNGETYFNTVALVTNVRNFPRSRGLVVGLLKGFTGLCGAIFTQIYTTFFAPDQAAYLLLVAVGPTMVACCLMFIIRPIENKQGDSSTRSESIGFTFIYAVCLVLAAYLMGVMLLQDFVTVSYPVSLTITGILLFLVALPLATPLVSWFARRSTIGNAIILKLPVSTKPQKDVEEKNELSAPLITEPVEGPPDATDTVFTSTDLGSELFKGESRPGSLTGSIGYSELEDERSSGVDIVDKQKKMTEIRNRMVLAAAEGAVIVKRKKGPRRGEDFTLLQAFAKADFWLLFWALICGSGTGLTAIDNMGQMSQSQGYENPSVFVSMMSIWNFLGRLIGGSASEVVARDYALPRSWAMVVAQLTMAVGHFLFAMAWPGTLYIGSLLVGIGYGSHWGIVPPIVSEIFGMKYFGMLYNFFIMASPAGSIFFSGFLAGYLYDLEAEKQQSSGFFAVSSSSSKTCLGAVCFRSTFLIMMGVCIVGAILASIFSIRTKRVYKMLYGNQRT